MLKATIYIYIYGEPKVLEIFFQVESMVESKAIKEESHSKLLIELEC
jgi:hypothetical protein